MTHTPSTDQTLLEQIVNECLDHHSWEAVKMVRHLCANGYKYVNVDRGADNRLVYILSYHDGYAETQLCLTYERLAKEAALYAK